ncbi:MAG: hypothetical protein E7211_17280 [Clostridium lundense]|nr:hypothetical protein [Clostridium lundense]
MKKSNNLYTKAINKYNNGYIDNALELCERSIALNINNAAAINLKGLLLYFKGDLDNSRRLWKMNFQINRDRIASRYLEDTLKDKERFNLYKEALELINNLNINEAYLKLKKCAESDFNSINVNNYLALCCIKKGNYDMGLQYLNKVIQMDKKNSFALMQKKSVKKYVNNNNSISKYKVAVILCIVVVTLGSAILLRFFNSDNKLLSYKKDKIKISENKSYKSKEIEAKENIEPNNNNDNNIVKETQLKEEKFSQSQLKELINKKDFENLLIYIEKWNNNDLSINDKALYSKARDLLEKEGAQYFYNKGHEYLKSNKYKEAKYFLERAQSVGSKAYFLPDTLYMLGIVHESMEDIEKSIYYYSLYHSKYPNGVYEDVTLYKLALLYKDVDINKSKSYASILTSRFKDSMYNNSLIKEILNMKK